MTNRVIVIALMAFQRLRKSRVLIVMLILTLFALGLHSSLLVAGLSELDSSSAQQLQTYVNNYVYAVIMAFANLSALFAAIIGATVLRAELTSGTIYGVLAKPLSRAEYIAGSIAGGLFVLMLMWGFLVAVLAVVSRLSDAEFGTLPVAIAGTRVLHSLLFMATGLFLSVRIHSWVAVVLAMVLVNGAAVVATVCRLLNAFVVHIPPKVVDALCFPFPLVGAFDGWAAQLVQTNLAPIPVLPAVAHFVDYALVLIVLAYLSFRRLDLNRSSE